jgi:hypothetical protein
MKSSRWSVRAFGMCVAIIAIALAGSLFIASRLQAEFNDHQGWTRAGAELGRLAAEHGCEVTVYRSRLFLEAIVDTNPKLMQTKGQNKNLARGFSLIQESVVWPWRRPPVIIVEQLNLKEDERAVHCLVSIQNIAMEIGSGDAQEALVIKR